MPKPNVFIERVLALARSNRELAVLAAAAVTLLVLPDFIFYVLGYPTASVRKPESMLVAALVGLGLVLIKSRRIRLASLALLLLWQVLWLGCLAYFGRPLGPDQMLLAANEVGDITSGIIDAWRVLLPALSTVALSGIPL